MKAYRYKQLVYIPIYKNAATSHELLFGKILNWSSFLTEDINWDNDIVFAHISNPYTRHLRGTAQFLIQHKLESIIDDPRFEKLLSSGYFDHHSYPLSLMFGDKVNNINWIPLDHPTISGNTLTSSFLQEHGITISKDDIPIENQSSVDKKNMLNQIEQLAKKHNFTADGLFFMLDNDQVLYNRVISNF